MKIVDVQAIPLAIPLKPFDPPSPWQTRMRKQVLVRVLTDDGLVGLGEAFALGGPLAVANVIVESLRPMLVGQDPGRIEFLVDALQRASQNYARRGIGMHAISGVEIALWDLLGKARGASACELLGGPLRTRMRAYASLVRYDTPADVAAACRQYVGRGFGMLKLHQVDEASVRAAREAVGPDVELMLDTNCPWPPAEARAMAGRLEPYRLFWLEEPIWPPEDYDALAQLRRAAPMPIALGENESTLYGFREIIARRAADVLQPSIIKVGGIAEFRKIAALAAAANVPIAPHSFYLGPGLAATLHIAATLGGSMPVEFPALELVEPFLAVPIAARDGHLEVPSGPGLGVEVNEEAIERYHYRTEAVAAFEIGPR
jgi:L-alanine-DL-glutamate epimerase-like enolase superfamily enzyme